MSQGEVICYLASKILLEPIPFYGDPILDKINGVSGYLMPSGDKVVFFYSVADGELFYDELKDWSILSKYYYI